MMDTNNPQLNLDELGSDNPAIRMGTLARIFMAAPKTKAELLDIAACLNDSEEDIRVLAVETLGKWGSEAVPFISKALAPEQPERVRIFAASSLGRMGVEAESAVLPLSLCLESDDDLLIWHAGFALSKIGTPAFPELKNKLGSENPKTVRGSIQALGWMEKKSIEAVEMIKALGERKDPELAVACASALIRISGDTEKGLAELFSGMEQANAELKQFCIREMGLLGNRAKEGRELLVPFLSDPGPEIRSETALALARIGHPTPDLVQALIPLLSDKNEDVKANTGIALSVYGNAASPALSALQAMAHGEDPRLCAIARKAIQAIQV